MELATLTALMQAGTVHNFRGTFGGRPEGARGTVIKVGAPAAPNTIRVRDIAGGLHTWDRRTMSVA
ncbi:hypothetical protein AB0958_18965 [Streptomyces sp. NPDC006655]|uniref:hypothetical protein n=1 Tax=Streptomyces sp. NPDC006655 TaxID=3156898 RepID=UPI0034541B9B